MSRFSFKSLRSRLLIVLLGVTALPALLIGGLANYNARQTIEQRVIAQLNSIVDFKKARLKCTIPFTLGLVANFLWLFISHPFSKSPRQYRLIDLLRTPMHHFHHVSNEWTNPFYRKK